MDTLDLYFVSNSLWLALQSLVLLVAPRLAILLLAEHTSPPTDLEVYLCRAVALPQLTLAGLLLALRIAPQITDQETNGASKNIPSNYVPILLASSLLHISNFALAQIAYYQRGYTGHALGAVISALFWAVSLLLLLLGPGSTGSGKTHTSHWPLGERKGKRRLADDSGEERKKL